MFGLVTNIFNFFRKLKKSQLFLKSKFKEIYILNDFINVNIVFVITYRYVFNMRQITQSLHIIH